LKRICSLFLILSFWMPQVSASGISAECACVMVAETGEVIFEKNAQKQHAMASTTKIMTALLALETTQPDEVVTVSRNAQNQEGSSLYLREGEQIRMEDLLFGLMLNSGNDAAVAVAEHIAGDVPAFSEQMTMRAAELGAVNTQFQNPNGLDAPGHYTTAYDLALIASAAMKNPEFRSIVSTRQKTATLENGHILYFSNHNKLLHQYDGAIGVKTGFTKKTGRCLVSAAERNGVLLIAVTLNAPDDWNDHKKLLDDGFSEVSLTTLLAEGYVFSRKTVNNQEICFIAERAVLLPAKNPGKISVITHMPEELSAPLNRGDKVGEAEVFRNGEKITTVSILSDSAIREIAPKKPFPFLKILCRFLFGV